MTSEITAECPKCKELKRVTLIKIVEAMLHVPRRFHVRCDTCGTEFYFRVDISDH